MKTWELFFVAIALGCDAFAVGLGVGTRFCSPRQIFRLSFHFGLFQFLMPLLGWFLGRQFVGLALQWGPWIAFFLLILIGLRMCYESLKPFEKKIDCPDPTKGYNLVALSLATSMDALGVGFSLGILERGLFLAAVWIGMTAGLMTWTAMKLGNRLSERFGQWMGLLGGVILLFIAIKLLMG